MTGNDHKNSFAEDVSASLTRALEDIGSLDDKSRSRSRNGSGSKSSLTAPSADNMAEALDSPINQVLGKADGGFLANLLDGSGTDDPASRDYGERYQYLDVLGEGGQGKVLRFRDTVLDRDVAIKVVKPPHTTDRENLLENEARLGGMLEHPNILPTYDLQRDETGSPFFVMKKVEGVSLDELLKKAHADGAIHKSRDRGEYSRRRLLNIFLQVCHGIQYAHSRGVCHLDLKPQNVTLGPFGEVYVLDWGFASRADDSPKMVAGTPLYIAPERFRPGKPDARCDVYSLGVMLYRILVNQLPRDVGKISFKEFRRRIAEFPIIPPRQRDPSLPRDLEAIIMKSLSENPDDRYQTVGELASDLERFLDILPVTAYRDGVWGRSLKFARRHRATVAAAAVMLVALLLTAGASLRASRLSDAAEMEQRRLAEKAELALLRMTEEQKRAQNAEEERRISLQQQKEAEARYMRSVRLRGTAHIPMEKGLDIMDKSKTALDREKDKTKRLQLLQPAINLFTQVIEILDGDEDGKQDAAKAYYSRARAYEQAHQYNQAKKDYQAALAMDKSVIMAHYYLGMLYFNDEDNAETTADGSNKEQRALTEFAAMNEIDFGNEFSEVGQAYIDVHQGRYDEALKRVDNIEKKDRAARGAEAAGESWRNPGLANVWLIRGLLYSKKESKYYNPEKGIEAYTNYLLYDSDKPSPFSNRGVLHEALYVLQRTQPGKGPEAERHLDLAFADYTRALEVDATFKTALQHRGYAYFKYRNDIDAALKDINAALAIDPNYPSVILDRGSIHEELRQYDLAEQDYQLVKKIQPRNTSVDYRFGILYLYTNQLDKSEEYLTKSINILKNGQSKGVRYHRRGSIRFLMGKYDDAVKDFDLSLSNRSGGQIYPALMRWLALAKLGRTPSQAEFVKSIRDDDNRPWLTVVASIFMGDTPQAEEQAFSLASNPEAVCETAFYLGARAWIMNDFPRAVSMLERAGETNYHLATEYNMAKILLERVRRQYEDSQRLPDRVGLPPTVPSMSDLVDPDGIAD